MCGSMAGRADVAPAGGMMPMVTDAPNRPLRPGLFQTDPPALLGSRCVDCGVVHYPPKRACPDCHGGDVTAVALSTRGVVRAVTVVRNAPTFFQQPYALAYVELAEGIQIFTQLAGIDPDQIHIGMSVELSIEPLRKDVDGTTDVIAYRFRPVAEQEKQ